MSPKPKTLSPMSPKPKTQNPNPKQAAFDPSTGVDRAWHKRFGRLKGWEDPALLATKVTGV